MQALGLLAMWRMRWLLFDVCESAIFRGKKFQVVKTAWNFLFVLRKSQQVFFTKMILNYFLKNV